MHIGIVVFTKNCLQHTRCCLDTLQVSYKHTVMVVDDFSSDGTKEWLKETQREFREFADQAPAHERNMQDFIIVEDLSGDCLAARWNHAVQALSGLGCDVVLLCNNDILFHASTVNALAIRMEEGWKDPMLSAAVVSAHNVRGQVEPEMLRDLTISTKTSEAPHPDFSCFLLDVKAWKQVGGFAECFKPMYFEDNHFHTMLKIHGLKAISTTAAPYYHYGSVAQNQKVGGVCTGEAFERNRTKFVEIFGGLPDELDIAELRTRFL